MDKNSVGRYFFVFEPKYSYHQFAVNFTPSGDVQITKVSKYSDVPYGKTSGQVKKNTLGDIDKVTTALPNAKAFFKEYVDPKIFSYYGINLHKMFIGYKDAGRMKSLRVAFNEPSLYEKTQLVQGSRIKDGECISSMIELLTDPDSEFLSYVYNHQVEYRKNYFSSVSDGVIQIANDLKRCKNLLNIGGETGILENVYDLESQLRDRLSSYKEFREMFLLRNKYIYDLDQQKQKLEIDKNKLVEEKTKKNTTSTWSLYKPEELDYVVEQLSLFDMIENDNSKVKKLK